MSLPEAAISDWSLADGFYRDGRLAPLRLRHGLTGRCWGDMRLSSRRRAALAKAGAPEPDARLLRQTHGTDIAFLNREGFPAPMDAKTHPDGVQGRSLPLADGWMLDRPGAVAAVYVADCLPVWIWERSGKAAGVFHAGWRGVAGGMPAKAVGEFSRAYGIAPADLEASVGPHIGPCCYRVGEDVAARFRPGSLRRGGKDIHLDLGAEVRAQLSDSGVPAEAVAVSAECTSCAGDRLFSYRREGRGCGEMLAFLWLEG